MHHWFKGLGLGAIVGFPPIAAMPVRIELCDVATVARRLWKEIVPPDPAGVLTIGPIFVAADGKSYIYSYRRQLDELYLVRGVE